MLFCTLPFLIFFSIVFSIYWLMPWSRPRVWLLLIASFTFYATWNTWLAWIVCVTSTADYVLARCMNATDRPALRRWLLYVSLAMNIGLLFYFKYMNFFLDSLRTTLETFGQRTWDGSLDVIVPIGISFYTFEAINYMVDVYRGRLRAEKNLANFMLFILFFPHLVAGPIVRARDFLCQIDRRKRWSWPRMHVGMRFCLLGVIKKLAIADRLAQFVDPVFAAPDQYNTGAMWCAVIAYSIQIYCDFSGYSDMALGTAHMLGYRLAINFNMPYIAKNVSEYWQRWHISLSNWLRDYVFFPLTLRGKKRRGGAEPTGLRMWIGLLAGGPRGSRYRIYFGLMMTMLVCGIWHGAHWTYIVAGFLHGALLIVHRIFGEFCKPRPRLVWALDSVVGIAARITATYLAVSLLFVLFRAPTLAIAGTVYHRLAVMHTGLGVPLHNQSLWATVLAIGVAHLITLRGGWAKLIERFPAPVRGLSYATGLSLALVLAPEADKAFIYFQF